MGIWAVMSRTSVVRSLSFSAGCNLLGAISLSVDRLRQHEACFPPLQQRQRATCPALRVCCVVLRGLERVRDVGALLPVLRKNTCCFAEIRISHLEGDVHLRRMPATRYQVITSICTAVSYSVPMCGDKPFLQLDTLNQGTDMSKPTDLRDPVLRGRLCDHHCGPGPFATSITCAPLQVRGLEYTACATNKHRRMALEGAYLYSVSGGGMR